MTALRIADGLALPAEAVTQTFALLAIRGSGKTYTAAVMVEEMVKAGLPVAVLDPIGVWWGLRADAAGTGPGLPVVVFGGDHGDLPLEPGAGEAMADVLVDLRPPAVLDLSLMRKGEQQRFVTAFAERLYHRNRDPLHLMLDEADAWAPQRPVKGTERLLGSIEDLVRRGRARGLGVTLITQRPAVLHKDVLTQIQVLVCLRMVAPQDRGAIDDWVRIHGTPAQRDELMASLPSLPVGEAWVWSPGWLDLFKRVKIRKRETFDSSATPKVGQKRSEPRVLAEIDLAALRERMSAAVERAEAEDPKALRRRIAELERELRTRPEPERVVERIEVPAIPEGVRLVLRDAAQGLAVAAPGLLALSERLERVLNEPRTTAPAKREPTSVPTRSTAPRPIAKPEPAFDGVSAYALGLLTVLAQRHPMTLTRSQLSVLSGRRPRSSSYQAAIAELKRGGLVAEEGGAFRTTDAGLAIAGVDGAEPVDVLATWRAALPKVERVLLDVLVEEYPTALTRPYLSTRSGYSATSSSFQAAIGSLKRNGLAEEDRDRLRAAAVLVGGGR